MTRIASIATGLRKLGWSAFGMVLTMGLPCVLGHAQEQAVGKASAVHPALLASNPSTSQGSTATKSELTAERQRSIEQNYMRQPLTFQPNVGQTDKRVQFLSHGAGYSLFLTPADAVLSLEDPPQKTSKGEIVTGKAAALEMVAVGGNKAAAATGMEPETSHTNYLIGNDQKKWHQGVQNFSRVKYAGIYPGIDLTYYGNQSELEYDFVVSPGADPHAIKLQLKGMRRLHLDPKGELLIDTAVGQVRLDRPVLYQENADGSRQDVQGKFVLARNEVHFKIGDYDKSKALVIDPILAYSSYLGGSNEENYTLGHLGNYVSGIAVDQSGAAYITGISLSTTDFPFVGAQDAISPLVPNAVYGFVAKFSQSGVLEYSTFLGGSIFFSYTSDAAIPGGIAVDSTFHAYITGYTTTSNFPFAGVVYQNSPYPNGATGVMGFVTKLDTSGGLNVGGNAYSTYLYPPTQAYISSLPEGGNDLNNVGGYIYLNAIAVDANNDAYVTGGFGPYFPTTSGAFQSGPNLPSSNTTFVDYGGDVVFASNENDYSVYDVACNAAVVELDQYGQNVLYASYLGGTVNDVATGIAVDSTGIYLTGYTDSKTFPTAPAGHVIQLIPGGARQAFVAKLNPAATGNAQLVYSTYLGGTGGTVNGIATGDEGHAITINASHDAYITGSTASNDFPTANPLQAALAGGPGDIDAFVAKLNPAGTALTFSTYLGGSMQDSGQGIAVDPQDNFYVTGFSYSMLSNFAYAQFPTTTGALPVSPNLGANLESAAFLTEYNAAATGMIQSTLFASPTAEGSIAGTAIAVDSTGNAYITGETKASDMLTTQGAHQTTLHGTSDAFMAKIWPLTITDSDNILPAAIDFGDVPIGTTTAQHTVTLTSNEQSGLNVVTSNLGGANPSNFNLSDGCTGQVTGIGQCTNSITFTPTNGGPYHADFTFNISDDEGMARQIPVQITGNGAGLQVQPDPVIFVPTAVGGTTSLLVSLQSFGPSVTINSLTIPAGTGFIVTPNAGSSCIPGVTLSNSGGCELRLSFSPTAPGAFSSTLTINETSGGNTYTQPVTIEGLGSGLALSPNPAMFPEAEVGSIDQSAVTLTATNSTGANLTITNWSFPAGSAFSVSPIGNTCQTGIILGTLPGNDSCIIYLLFSPTSLGLSTSTFTIDTSSGGPWMVALSGQGIAPFASVSPATLSFPTQVVNTTSTVMQAQITNTGPLPLNIAGFSVPFNSGYALSTAGTTCAEPVTLAAQTSTSDGGHCYVGVTFTPTATGIDNSHLTFYDNSGGSSGATQLVALSGTGVLLALNPNSLAFPNTAVGTPSGSMSTTLTNTSSSALTLTSVSIPGSAGFTISAAGSTCTASLVLPALTGSCTVSVIFTPAAVGAVTGQLSVTNSASGTPLTVALSGTGIASAATPIFSPVAGTYPSAQSVTISDATGGATIYYTTNGTTPTANSTPYTGAITVSSTETIEAIAIATGDANSAVATATYTIETAAATPIFSPAAGTYPSAQSVTISDATTGATIYYTTNGTTPTASSTPYTGAITVSSTETIEAIAVATGYNNSVVASVTYTIETAAATPIFTPVAGTYPSTQSITISDATTGATIYYTTNGTAPTTSSTPYTGAVTVSSTETIEAIAVATGYNNSAVASATYTIETAAATPIFTPVAGTFPSTQSVTISDATTGATIYYTTNGTTPTTSSTPYTGSVTVSSTETIDAIAVATGYNNSAVASATYTIETAAATPIFTPVAGTYPSTQSVTISDATTGATIYYTTNGTMPTTSSTPYTGAITVSSTETIEAIAVATGYNNSAVATATYTIQVVAAPQAVLTPSTLTFSGTQVGATSAIQTITLSNPGNAALSITGVTYSGSSAFVETNNCGATLAAGGSCTFSYTFTPTGTGAVSGGLSVVDNTENSPQTATINGTGTSAPVAPDFTISVADPSATVLPGGTATFNITGTPVNTSTFPAAVMLTTSGLPTAATAIFSPASIASGAGAAPVTLTIQLPQTIAMAQPAGGPRGGTASRLAPYALALLMLPFVGTLRRNGKRFGRMLTLLLLLGVGVAAVAGLSGCNSTSGFLAQAPQTYTVTVTGTMGTLTHSTTVTLSVK